MKTMKDKTLEELIRELPEELQVEVRDFVEFLLEKKVRFQKRAPKLDWRGAARHLRDQYTSVELQHKIRDWWDEDVSAGH